MSLNENEPLVLEEEAQDIEYQGEEDSGIEQIPAGATPKSDGTKAGRLDRNERTPVHRRRSFALAVLNSAVRTTPRPRSSLLPTQLKQFSTPSNAKPHIESFSTRETTNVELDCII